MKGSTKAYIYREGGKILSDVTRLVLSRPKKPSASPESEEEAPSEEKTISTIQKPEEVRQSGSTGILTREGLDPETMKWQLGLARADLWDLEGHLKNKCLDCGKDVDCCWKHGQNLVDNRNETKSMTTDPFWDEIGKLGEEVKMKAHPDAIRAGTYFNEFPELVMRTSKLRREADTKLMQLSKPELTLEEAKQLAAEEAAKKVEQAWGKEE